MRTCNCFKLVLALFGLGLTAIQTRAQSIYTPYAFTNFAGAPGGPGIADGIIIRQFPLRGAPVSGRDPITVVVSRQAEGGIIEGPAAPASTNVPTTTQ